MLKWAVNFKQKLTNIFFFADKRKLDAFVRFWWLNFPLLKNTRRVSVETGISKSKSLFWQIAHDFYLAVIHPQEISAQLQNPGWCEEQVPEKEAWVRSGVRFFVFVLLLLLLLLLLSFKQPCWTFVIRMQCVYAPPTRFSHWGTNSGGQSVEQSHKAEKFKKQSNEYAAIKNSRWTVCSPSFSQVSRQRSHNVSTQDLNQRLPGESARSSEQNPARATGRLKHARKALLFRKCVKNLL